MAAHDAFSTPPYGGTDSTTKTSLGLGFNAKRGRKAKKGRSTPDFFTFSLWSNQFFFKFIFSSSVNQILLEHKNVAIKFLPTLSISDDNIN